MAADWVPTTHSCQVPLTPLIAGRRPGLTASRYTTRPVIAIQASAAATVSTATAAAAAVSRGPVSASRLASTLAAAATAK